MIVSIIFHCGGAEVADGTQSFLKFFAVPLKHDFSLLKLGELGDLAVQPENRSFNHETHQIHETGRMKMNPPVTQVFLSCPSCVSWFLPRNLR